MRALLLLGIMILGLAAAQPAAAANVRLFVRHEVNDYAAWRKAYNEFDKTRRKLGVTAQAVYHDFKSVDKAKAFTASPELKAAMEKAGVKSAPQVWFTTRAAK